MLGSLCQGWYSAIEHCPSSHFNARPLLSNGAPVPIDLLVIHNISLPAGCFATPYVRELFLGTLDCTAHASFMPLQGIRVSAHFFIDRSGLITQFVSTEQRAWHAGVSCFMGKDNCNDYSLGIELEGTDNSGYTELQYAALIDLTRRLMRDYPIVCEHIVGHCDIALGRKTDPGEGFDWSYYKSQLINGV